MGEFKKVLGIGVVSGLVCAAAGYAIEQVRRMREYCPEDWNGGEPCVAEKAKCQRSHCCCPYEDGDGVTKADKTCQCGLSSCPHDDEHREHGPLHGPWFEWARHPRWPWNKPVMGMCPRCCPNFRCAGANDGMHWSIHTATADSHYCPFGVTEGCPHLDGAVEGRVCPWAWEHECPGKDTEFSDLEDEDFGRDYEDGDDDFGDDEDDEDDEFDDLLPYDADLGDFGDTSPEDEAQDEYDQYTGGETPEQSDEDAAMDEYDEAMFAPIDGADDGEDDDEDGVDCIPAEESDN